jgi:cytochrome P450
MTTVAPSIADFDPRSPDYYKDPQAAVQGLLQEAPVFYYEPLSAYYVLPYAEVRKVLADSDTYSSHAYKGVPVRSDLRDRIPEEWERAGHVIQGGQILNMDPPAHTPQRRAMQRTFTHRRVEAAKADIAAIADELIDGLIAEASGSCDLMHDYASQLTLRSVGRLMDVPPDVLAGFHAWVIDVLGILAPIDLKPEDVTTPDDQLAAIYERVYSAYLTYSQLIEERRASPGEDLCSAMVTLTDEDGTPSLTNDQILAHMVGITAAGTDTTANLIVNLVRYFTESPDQLELVLEDPALWDNAVLEGLRRAGISNQLFRISVKESELAGVTVPARSNVALLLPAANADPAKFPDPLRFDVRRENAGDHLSFGRGRHFCLGAPLAPPEARIAVESLYRRLPDLKAELDQELEFVPSLSVRGIISQRVSWSV